jgi:hypothetical protein
MAQSSLTVRTLALATVAFVLACGHAVKAVGAQKSTAERAVVKSPSPSAPIRVVPAGSGHSTVATFSNTGSSGARGGAHVATFTSKSGGSSNSVVTFTGDRVERKRVIASAGYSRPQQRARPKATILGQRGDPPIIAVRYSDEPQSAQPDLKSAPTAPATPEQKPAASASPPRIRNAFAGLSTRSGASSASETPPLVYAHAASR